MEILHDLGLNYYNALVIFIFASGILGLLIRKGRKPRQPPGPWGLPIVGYLPFVGKPSISFKKLATKYGPITRFKLGVHNVVYLSDFELLDDAFRREEFLGRPNGVFQIPGDVFHFGEMDGPAWKVQKRLLSNFYRHITRPENGDILQNCIREEASKLLEKISESEDESVNLRDILPEPLHNIEMRLINGKHISKDDPPIALLRRWSQLFFRQASPDTLTFAFPNWKHLLKIFIPTITEFQLVSASLETFIRKKIEEHRKNEINQPRDYIDFFLQERAKSGNSDFSISTLVGNCAILLGGGTDSLLTSLEWILLFLGKHQDVQKRVYEEIVSVVEENKLPSWDDRKGLHYTMATINEVLRAKTLMATTAARRVMTDTTLGGYFVPKDSLVFFDFEAFNMNEKYFENPHSFQPERYLSENGEFMNEKRSLAFSWGSRKCPGMNQSKMELFLFTTSIISRYHIVPPKEGLSLEETYYLITVSSYPFLRFRSRS